jgi:hypothetical protein
MNTNLFHWDKKMQTFIIRKMCKIYTQCRKFFLRDRQIIRRLSAQSDNVYKTVCL